MMNNGISYTDYDPSRYPELRKWVVSSLSGHKKPNDIIFQLCQRTGWDWKQAERFVGQITELDSKEVHRRRMPLLLGVGLFLMAGGVVAFLPAFLDMIADLQMLEPPWDLDKLFYALSGARANYYRVFGIFGGLAMFIGGGVGISNAIRSAISGEGEDLMKSGGPRNDLRL
jgi:hypothetical protein